MNRTVRLFSGRDARITCDDDQLKDEIYRVMIKPFLKDIEEGWLAKSQRAMPAENRIKNYLTYIGTLMIRKPDAYGVISENKRKHIAIMESNVSDVDDSIIMRRADKPVARKARREETTFERYEKLKKANPGNALSWTRVDTDGWFNHNGTEYRVIDIRYTGKRLAGWDGLHFDFDRVWILTDSEKNTIRFFDQKLTPIIPEHIFKRVGGIHGKTT